MKREPSKEWDMKKKTHHFALFSSYNLTGHLPGRGNIRYWLHVSGIVHILYIASPKPCKIMKREPSKEWDMKKKLTISHYLARTTSLDISLAWVTLGTGFMYVALYIHYISLHQKLAGPYGPCHGNMYFTY